MPPDAKIIVVILSPSLCKGIKNLNINSNGEAEVFLTNKTTLKDALEGNNVYGLSGKSGIIVTEKTYNRIKDEVERYLTNRFGDNWRIELHPVSSAT